MKFNERINPFNYGFFTRETDELSHVLYLMISEIEVIASFSIYKEKLPELIFPMHIPEVKNFKHNNKTGDFTSDIGNGKIVFVEKNEFKVVFDSFKYNDMPNLELKLNKQLKENMLNHKEDGVKH